MKTLNTVFFLLCASTVLLAQQPDASQTKITPPQRRIHRVLKPKQPVPTSSTPKTSSDFFVGEARIDVTKDETVVRLAMAQHGSVLIELPANDGPRYIIPGDPEMATVDEKALEKNKRAIVVRPGTQFVTPQHKVKARTPAATVTAQMRSGLVVTFLFYPVSDLAQNVHRCVLNYNRDEVVVRRRAAGLPVNLDEKEQGGEKQTAQSAAPISTQGEKPVDQSKEQQSSGPPLTNKASAKETKDSRVEAPAIDTVSYNKAELDALLSAALDQAVKKPKAFKNWTHSIHGLKLSILEEPDSGKPFKVLTLAVRNSTSASVKLLPDSPEVSIETIDDQGTTVNVHSIAKAQTEVSSKSNDIAAGTTVYFAIAYVSPVLDAHQRLKIAVAQTNAADQPASIKLATNGQ